MTMLFCIPTIKLPVLTSFVGRMPIEHNICETEKENGRQQWNLTSAISCVTLLKIAGVAT